MEERRLGRTGVCVSQVGIGTGAFPEAGAPQHGARLLCEAARLGVTFWDTANNYDTYREIRLALRRLGKASSRIVIASKVEAHSARGAASQLGRALRELGRDRVDIMLLHYVREPLRHWRGALKTLARAKRRGDVRAIGLSTHRPRLVREALEAGGLDCVFVTLNLAGAWIEGRGGRAAMIEACRLARRAGMGVVLLKVLASGQLSGRRVQALRWAARQPFADAILIGVETTSQLHQDLAALDVR